MSLSSGVGPAVAGRPRPEERQAATSRPSPRDDRLALLGLGLVVGVLFWPALLGRRVFFARDIVSYWLPQVSSFVRAVGFEGVPPLWNPLFAFGLPMLEDPGYQILYPFTWLNLVMEPGTYYTLFVTLHCLAAGAGLYALARSFGLAALPAWTAAAAFCAGGPLLSAANLNHHFASLCWTPWVLLALERLLSAPHVRAGLALGAAAGAQALAGSGDVCLMTAALCLGLVAWSSARAGVLAAVRRALPSLTLALVFATALSAAQALPTLSLARSAPRSRLDPSANMYWSIHPVSLLDVLVDRAVAGLPMNEDLRSRLFEGRGPLLASLYLGLPAALLVALGLLSSGPPRLGPWLLAGLVLCLLAALGRHAPLFPLLLKLPLVGLFRYPAKAMLLVSLLWALLVGLGFAAWQRGWSSADRRRAAAVAGLALLLSLACVFVAGWVDGAPSSLMERTALSGASGREPAILAETARALRGAAAASLMGAVLLAVRLRFARPPVWLSALMATIVVGDLVLKGRTVQPLAPPELFQHRPPLLERLGPEAGGLRVLSFASGPGIAPVRSPAGWHPSWAAALGAIECLRAPSAARWRIAGSFDGDFTGLAPLAQGQLTQWLVRHRHDDLGRRLLELGSVDYVIAVGDPPFRGLEPVGEWPSVLAQPIRLFRVPAPLPRVYWVNRARFARQDAVLAALADPGFDPRFEVILPEGSPKSVEIPGARATPRLLERHSDRVRIEVSGDGPGYVVLVEAHHPGWQAKVDAQPAPLLEANALFRAVPVPAGTHVIDMAYRPRSVYVGGFVSAVTLLVGCGLWALAGRRSVDSTGVAL